MALTSTRWRGIARLQSASENTPPMRFGEPEYNAAVVLQEVLIENGLSLPSGADGIYGRQTAAAVQAAEVQLGLDKDQGVASYAGFAANIFPPPGEPNPRFGLGPGQAL